MEPSQKQLLLDQIPILYVRGTHRTVGFTIGRQFKGMIEDLIQNWTYFNETVLPAYETLNGKQIYDDSLSTCRSRWPMYVEELEGMAEGCKIPFYKLFLLHIESVIVPIPSGSNDQCPPCNKNKKESTGCTSVLINKNEQILLGHTEDALIEFGNNVYIIAAEILDSSNGSTTIIEKFTTLTYAGHLPGYTMGFNSSFVYSINTQFPTLVCPGKTPRTFLTRAILGVSTFEQVQNILLDSGSGTSDGFSLNIIFWNGQAANKSIIRNIEVSPNQNSQNNNVSELSIYEIKKLDVYAHCNKYLRLKTPEQLDCASYSVNRHVVLDKMLNGNIDLNGLKAILSDESDKEYPIFRGCGSKDCPAKTVAVGIFDILKQTWSIYMGPPYKGNPIAVLHLNFNE